MQKIRGSSDQVWFCHSREGGKPDDPETCWKEMARRGAREEGILIGISSGATLAAIAQKLPGITKGSTVIGFNYDTGERYLSIEGFLPAE